MEPMTPRADAAEVAARLAPIFPGRESQLRRACEAALDLRPRETGPGLARLVLTAAAVAGIRPADEPSPLARMRHAVGLSQAAVGARLGVSGVAVAAWETGNVRLRIDRIRPLAAVYRVTPTEILAAASDLYPVPA